MFQFGDASRTSLVAFFDARVGSNPSWTWRSILEGRKVLLEGVRWRIGNGKKVRIDIDP